MYRGPYTGPAAGRVALTVASLLILAGGAGWGQHRVRQRARNDLANGLQSLVATTANGVATLLDQHRRTALAWSRAQALRDIVWEIAAVEGPPLHSGRVAREELRALLGPAIEGHGFADFELTRADGRSLAGRTPHGARVPLPPEFVARVLAQGSAVSLPIAWEDEGSDLKLVLFAASVVFGAQGEPLALLSFRIDPARELYPILARAWFGATGDAYAFDRTGRAMTPVRFMDGLVAARVVDDTVRDRLAFPLLDPGIDVMALPTPAWEPGRRPLTRAVAAAIEGASGVDVEGYRDYRGVQVLGAWTWVPALGMGFVVEIDDWEALASSRETLLILFGTAGLAGLLVVLLSWDAGVRLRVEAQLKRALEKVLAGHLPICASCKNIRNTEGEWIQLESYVSDATDAEFSHSICPTCRDRLYGEFLKD